MPSEEEHSFSQASVSVQIPLFGDTTWEVAEAWIRKVFGELPGRCKAIHFFDPQDHFCDTSETTTYLRFTAHLGPIGYEGSLTGEGFTKEITVTNPLDRFFSGRRKA
ncbi:MAG: hypothetical protein U1E51_31860 [Candidatus Binatia bacterium]|nr:hypothetical protein [Candidatus Binatia bacterium]